MLSFPNIKINIGLFVTEKRRDGYHNLLSCFMPVSWTDVLEITESTSFEFITTGLPIPGDPDKNLCVKAYQLLAKDFDLPPVRIHLHKILPMGGGLGGGSSNGSFTLKTLNNLFDLKLSDHSLEAYALQLGSDCPFFIPNKPLIASGRGEIFEGVNLNLSGKHLVLVNPGLHVSTAQAFAGIIPNKPEINLKEVIENQPIESWKEYLKNDFEVSVFAIHPQLKEIKESLCQMGALFASMSGTGSTVYGIFSQKPTLVFPKEYLVKHFEL